MAQLEKFKLSVVTWDSDKEPRQFFVWLENFGSLVRATEFENYLEDMLDSKLHRPKVSSQAVPSFLLEDPDFAPNTAKSPEKEKAKDVSETISTSESASSGASKASGHFSLGVHHKPSASVGAAHDTSRLNAAQLKKLVSVIREKSSKP